MKTLLAIILLAACVATGYGQTIKSLGYNTTNGRVVYSGTNDLAFTNTVAFGQNADTKIIGASVVFGTNTALSFDERALYGQWSFNGGFDFGNTPDAPAALSRTNLGLGLPALTNTSNASFRAAIELGGFWSEEGWANLYDASTNLVLSVEDGVEIYRDVKFGGTNATANAAITRTNLGLPLAALTNTGNVTMMRALSGSTNTNYPFSGSVSVVGTNNTNTLVFSNGILQSVQ